MAPFESLGAVSYSHFVATMACLWSFVRYFASYDGVTLKTGLGVVQGHWDGAVRWTIYEFILVVHCKYSSI